MTTPTPPVVPNTELRGRDTEIVIAVFRTVFILVVLFSDEFTAARANVGRVLVPAVIAAAAYNLLLFLLHLSRRPFPRWLIIFGDLVLITLWIYLCGRASQVFFGLYYAVVIVAAMWFGIWGALLSAVAASGMYVGTILLSGLAFDVVPPRGQLVLQVIFLLGTAGLVSIMANLLQHESEELAVSRATIQQNLQRIRIAQRVDDLVRPRRLATLPGFDIAFRFRPAAQAAAAGDYYDVIRLGGRRLGVCVGDICAKLEMAIPYLPVFKAEFRAAARREPSPAKVLAEMNRWVTAEFEERQDREGFISMCYFIIDLDRGRLTYAVAGHEPPLLLPGSGGEPVSLTCTGIVFGVVPDAAYEQKTRAVHSGDLLVLFTDGLIEVTNAQREFLGREGLVRHLLQHASLSSADEIAERVFAAANDYGKPGQRRDDMTLLVVRVTAEDVGSAAADEPPDGFAHPD